MSDIIDFQAEKNRREPQPPEERADCHGGTVRRFEIIDGVHRSSVWAHTVIEAQDRHMAMRLAFRRIFGRAR